METANSFQHDFSDSFPSLDEYYHWQSSDATVTVPHKCTIIGKEVAVIPFIYNRF